MLACSKVLLSHGDGQHFRGYPPLGEAFWGVLYNHSQELSHSLGGGVKPGQQEAENSSGLSPSSSLASLGRPVHQAGSAVPMAFGSVGHVEAEILESSF